MTLLQMSLSGAVLVAVIVALRAALLYRMPKRTFVALWWVALVRLLIPFSAPSVTSIYALLGRLLPGAAAAVRQRLAAPITAAPSAAAVPADTLPPTASLSPAAAALPAASASMPAAEAALPAAAQPAADGAFLWGLLWLVGAVVCALVLTAAYVRCRREFRTALPVEQEAVARWKRQHPLRRTLDIRQSDRIDAPLTYGMLRPVILLPKNTDWNDEGRLDYVLLHEYIHIRRWDAASKLAAAAALCLYWFNPMVWVLYALFNRDIELACDEAVLRRQKDDRRAAYARTLIDLEARRSGLMPLCSAFGKNANEERITAIMKTRKRNVWAAAAACVLVVAVAGVFATSPKKEENAVTLSPQEMVEQALADAHADAADRAQRAQQNGSQTTPTVLPINPQLTELERRMASQRMRFELEDGYWVVFAENWFKNEIPVEYIDEWWTYEEYQAYIKELRASLEAKIGQTDRQESWEAAPAPPKEFVWTQERVDETMRLNELKLQAMEEGYLLAKSACGNRIFIPYAQEELTEIWDHRWYLEAPLPDGTKETLGPYYCLLDRPQAVEDQIAARDAKWAELLAPYAPYGVTSRSAEHFIFTQMYYQGREVRCIYDEVRGLTIGEWDSFPVPYDADAIDLCAVYDEAGALTGLREATEEEMQVWTELRRAVRSEAANSRYSDDVIAASTE